MNLAKSTFWGYKRENGRIGVRNHVIILPVDDLSNAAAQAVENNVKGTLALPHPYGRLQFGADLELHFRTLIGTGSNPNVAAVVVICIEDQWAKKVADAIAATGKPVAYFGIEQHGDHDTILRASKKAKEFVQWASELHREERPLKDLWVSTKCGESDTTSGCGSNPTVGNAFDKLYPHGVTLVFGETTELTGGEHLVAARCRNDEVRKKFQFMFDRYAKVVDQHKTSDLMDSQPTKGNIAGGLTTIEEKALGNIQKIPLRHHGNIGALHRQSGEIREDSLLAAYETRKLVDFLMRSRQKILQQSQFMDDFQCGGVDSVAPKIAQEIGMFFEHDYIDASTRQQKTQHHARGPAARNAASCLYLFGGRDII